MTNTSKMFGIGMFLGGVPLTFFIFLVLYLSATHDAHRAAGYPSGGDALGLMMMSLLAYVVALLSCVAGVGYFLVNAFRHHGFPGWWQWLCLLYSCAQVIAPYVYFVVLDLR